MTPNKVMVYLTMSRNETRICEKEHILNAHKHTHKYSKIKIVNFTEDKIKIVNSTEDK
uniref:Uncharacterized protein n=2 Tax=Arion vulgaris TaxID=1028688 RepID=A0A0B6YY30_9EUPU